MAVEKRGVAVEVVGVPDFMSDERTVDKLLIHFLRPRNGGGEVQRVIYPTRSPGQALVLYEDPDVASRVLQKRHHALEVGDQTYPLEVKPADRPELDLPVEFTMNLSTIADKTALKRLIRPHGFEVIYRDRRADQLRLKGSMMMLRPFKAEAEKLRTPNLTRPTSSSSSSGQSSSQSPPGAVSKNSTHGSSAQAKPRPLRSIDAPAYASPSSSTTSSPSSSSSSLIGKTPEESFIASSDVVDYAQRYKKNGIADVLASHNVEMDVVAMDGEVSSVIVRGRDAHSAARKLRSLLGDLDATLHIRKVPLDDLDHDAQVGVAKRVQELKHSCPSVLIKQTGGAIHLIGPRSSCDQLKERLLAERPAEPSAPVRAGRSEERSREPKSRGRSVPRNALSTSRRGELAGQATAKFAPLSSLDGDYSSLPSRFGDEGDQGAAVRGQRGRSSSLTRASATPEKTEANHGSTERTNVKPATRPAVKTSLMPDFKAKKFKALFSKH